MRVVEGTLEFANAMLIILNEFRFESGTTVIVPIADLSIDCSWFNAGGTFDHNNGTFIFAYTTFYQYVNQNGINLFNNLVLEANDGQDITLNDTLHAEGLVELKDGRYTGWPIQAFGNVDVYEDFDQTTGDLIFAGNFNKEYRIKATSSKFTNTYFKKNGGAKVDMYLENMSYGNSTEDYHIESGELCIMDGKNDMDINRFLIKGGTLKAPDSLKYSG